ncbi:MAG: HlyD family efflux transporter periplasmic adaptor subunit [Sedimentisphaerales bacterium]|nr:HlyD family efflux transporter periplasmic adaptor subunit [Sedimentisphaerales bacterium]
MTDHSEGQETTPVAADRPQAKIGQEAVLPPVSDNQQVGILMARLLVAQCSICHVRVGAVFAIGPDGSINLLAACPSPDTDRHLLQWFQWSGQAVQKVLTDPNRPSGPWQVLVQPASDLQYKMAAILISMDLPQVGRFVETFAIPDGPDGQLLQGRLVQLVRMVEAYDQQIATQGPAMRLQIVGSALKVLTALQKQTHFVAAAMEFCNQLATGWCCDRVSLGVLSGRMVKAKAISHVERFNRKTRQIQLIEAAMEEAIDQDAVVLWPVSQDTHVISRATAELAQATSAKGLVVIPLLEGQQGLAIVLERSSTFDDKALEAIKLACQLCGPILLRLWTQGRWFGVRLVHKIKAWASLLVGPTYTWAKLAACIVTIALAWTVFGKGVYRVHAPFVLSAELLQGICAPFDGYLKQVYVEVGQAVESNKTVLAELDTAELKLQLASAKAELASYLKQVDAYMRDGQTAKAQVSQAGADEVQAQIDLIEHMIRKATLVSPTDGTIVKGDLKKQIGSPVKTGQVLFEVTPLETLYAELLVPEDQILDLKIGQEGALATASFPGQRLPIRVERINPMAEVVNGRNVFRVRATLLQTRQWLRPGMEGLAKVTIDRRPYLWIWTRKLVNWLRMRLWI